jgi:hypothetical protein
MALSPNQAHGGKSRPAKVTLNSGFKTNVPMTTCDCTPKPGSKLKVSTFPTNASLAGNGVSG